MITQTTQFKKKNKIKFLHKAFDNFRFNDTCPSYQLCNINYTGVFIEHPKLLLISFK